MERKEFLKKITYCVSESNCIEVMPMKKVDFNNFQLLCNFCTSKYFTKDVKFKHIRQ